MLDLWSEAMHDDDPGDDVSLVKLAGGCHRNLRVPSYHRPLIPIRPAISGIGEGTLGFP